MAGYYTLDIAKLTEQRLNNAKQPFDHQSAAFSALSKTLPTPIQGYRGTLLVLPTGGGKTFTSINWICRNILSKGIKVLWLAQSSYLIDQAAGEFCKEIHNAVGRDFINLRVVSSSTSHANSGSISITDDILICTTQTAISAYSSEQLDGMGNIVKTPFRKFIDNFKDSELFIVVDEAHHTPAYGCRTLLLSIRDEIKNLYILGLTATPMHGDKRISGWLGKIYDTGNEKILSERNIGICYEADKNVLQVNKVLSVPKYIPRDTGEEFEVDDGLFDRLVNKHKDLPETIIESLANNQARNNFIVSDYLNNKPEYGKTLIFADRWFQCEYLVEKLKEQGIRANAVYSVVTGQDAVHRGGSGRRNNKENEQIMRDFRAGKYDVIVNVKMLTEGVDVPDVKTVMITRQTTSNILLTQMIGRALRGEKAGGGKGKDYANIVFFHDTWKRLLPWAGVLGGTEPDKPPTQGRNPMILISTHLIKLAAADIEYRGFDGANFLTFIPVGFFNCEYTVAIEKDSEDSEDSAQEFVSFEENIVAYEFNKEKYDILIEFALTQDLSIYANENVNESQLKDKAEELADEFFDFETDDFDGMLIENVTKIIHHVAQNKNNEFPRPRFIDFHERDLYDLDKIAYDLLNTPPLDADIILTNKFNDTGFHWSFLYKTFNNFMDAYYKSQKRVLEILRGSSSTSPNLPQSEIPSVPDLTEEIKRQVYVRDKHTCLCCGKSKRQGVIMNVDHIRPVTMGGTNDISNLQTLCKYCNTIKGLNEINYKVNASPLRNPKPELQLFDRANSGTFETALSRIVNIFYHCKAMCAFRHHKRSNGQFYSTWEIVLYSGNNPEWLQAHEDRLLEYVHSHFGEQQVKRIVVRG